MAGDLAPVRLAPPPAGIEGGPSLGSAIRVRTVAPPRPSGTVVEEVGGAADERGSRLVFAFNLLQAATK